MVLAVVLAVAVKQNPKRTTRNNMNSKLIYLILLFLNLQVGNNCIAQDLTCKMLKIVTQDGFFMGKQDTEIYIVDTFRLFSTACIISERNKKIFVVRAKPSKFTIVSNNLFYVSGIAVEKNLFQIVITNPRASYQFVYYLSILGNNIKLVKKKGGTPPS